MRNVLLLVVTAVLVVVLALELTITSTSRKGEGLVGIYFYPWYSSDGRHWDASRDPVWAVVEKPIIGFYDSRDENVLRWQLKLVRDAGIDFIILSWWGPESFEDSAAKIVIQHIKEHNLKFAILIEPYLGNETSQYDRRFWENALSYIRANYVEQYRDVYFHLYDKPLIVAFNPIGMYYSPHKDFPDYAIRIVGNDIDNARYQDWDYWPDYLVNASSVELKVRKDYAVSIAPRFCGTHFRTPGVCLDPDLSQGLYKKQWDWIIKNANEINIVIITSWNEYHERTQVEPSYSNETRDPRLLYEVTKKYVALYRARSSRASLAPLLIALIVIALAASAVFKLVSKLIIRRRRVQVS